MAHPNLVLPFRGEQFSFALSTRAEGDADKPSLVDFAAVAFNRQGQFLDVVHAHKATALFGAISTHREPSLWPEGCQAVPGEDVVHVMPKLLEPKAEVLVLVASVAHNPGQAQSLASAAKVELTITFATEDDNRALDNHVTVNLTDTARYLASQGQGQSMLLGVVFLDQPGWTVRFDHAGSAQPAWSLMVPELQAAVLRVKTEAGIPLDAAVALEQSPPDDTAIVPFSRLNEDRALTEATRFRLPDAAPVGKLRVDVGWKFWKKGPEDEIEGAAVEFVIKFYNAAGEEVQSAGTNEREAAGVAVGRPEPEEAEEAAEEEPPAEEEPAEGEGEGGAEGEEGGEPKEPPPPPPEPAEDPYEFKLRDVAFVTLEELPKDVRSFVVLVSNYGGAGFLPLKHAGARLFDVTGGEEKARPLAEWHHISKFEQEDKVTQVALLKVYKEYDDSAWNLWRASGAKDVAEFVGGDAKALMAALKEAQAKHKAWKAVEAKAQADAEESGEEVTKDLRAHHWRYSVPGLVMGGESLDAAEHDVKNNLLNYDGPLRSLEARSCSCARVQFGGEKADTFFGGYHEDLKHGPGVYCFASGAFYVGHYKSGKREGSGVLLLPDGGEYVGEFAGDRFHGQGQYRYPDGSVYTGSWEAGQKHGAGVYWDTKKGCLRGSWVKGVLAGTATYDQPAISFQGEFVAGVPAGPGHFTVAAHRTLDLHKFAASHILDTGPTLRGKVEYAIPAGSGDPPKLDEEGQPIEDPDKPPLPAFPKYEGLTFKSTVLPISIVDKAFPPHEDKVPPGTLTAEREEATMVFPPAGGLPVPIKEVPRFSVPTGLLPPEPEPATA